MKELLEALLNAIGGGTSAEHAWRIYLSALLGVFFGHFDVLSGWNEPV